jgi:hypothetical protein
MYIYLFVRWPVLFAIGGQTARPIRPKIGRNTHWDNAMKIGGSAIANAHICAPCGRKRAQHCPVPIQPNIGSHTHWDNAMKIGVGDREASAH